jgi:hypothetical protein
MNPTIKNIKLLGAKALCLVIVFTSFFAEAQTQKFQKVYGGYSYDYGNDLIQTADSGYLLLCTSNSFSNSSDIYLLKVDQQGSYEWQRTYGGNEIEGACKIKFTQDGNIAMAGHTSSYLNNSYDFYLVKANMNGDTLWTKHYGTNEWDFANSMDTCADGGFIMAGKTYDTGNAFSDILIVKTDADGNEQWQKKVGGNKDDVANSIISVPDGYLIVGNSFYATTNSKDVYIAKIDLNGNVISENYIGGPGEDEGGDIIQKTDGFYALSCSSHSLLYPQNFNNLIVNYNLTTNSIVNIYESNYTNDVKLNSIVECFDGTVLSVGNISNLGSGFGDMFLVKLSTGFYFNGGSTYGGNFEDVANNVIATIDSGYALIGSTNSFGLGLNNIYFVKLDSTLIIGGLPDISVSIKETNQLVAAQNQIYPNPFNTSTTINIDFPVSLVASNTFTIKVLDQLGNEVSNQVAYTVKESNKGSSITINNLSLSNGMYFYSLILNDRAVAQGKFTIIK